ncbi:outer membrane protein assembly factor BamB family protein [Streptomyces spiralis]
MDGDPTGAVVTAPTIGQGRMFIGMDTPSSSGRLGVRALDAGSGRTLRHTDSDGQVCGAPVVDAGVLYATAAGGTVFTLDPANGRGGRRTKVDEAGQGLAIADGVVRGRRASACVRR